MDILHKVGSAVLLLVGGLYPLAAIYVMMRFTAPSSSKGALNATRVDGSRPSPAFFDVRRPQPFGRLRNVEMMLHFVLIATVPLAGRGAFICTGNTSAYRGVENFAGFAPTLWESQVIRVIVYGAGVLSLAAFVLLFFSMRSRQLP